MHFAYRSLVIVMLLALPATRAFSGDVPLIEEEFKPPDIKQYDPKYEDYLAKKKVMRANVAKAWDTKVAEMQQKLAALAEARAKLEVPKTDQVTVDEETIQVKEPVSVEEVLGRKTVRDLYEKNPEDFDILTHDRWSIDKSDFRIDQPQYVVVDMASGETRKYFGFTFSITNSTTKARRIAPVMVAATNYGAFSWEVGGFIPQRKAANDLYRPMGGSDAASDKRMLEEGVAPVESVAEIATSVLGAGGTSKPALFPDAAATFQPGETRWGVALWPEFNDNFQQLKVIVYGLTNSHRYEKKQRRVLIMDFTRDDDEFDVLRTKLEYKGKDWKLLWMWDQDLTVPIPTDAKEPQIKDKVLTTPSAGQRLLWSFPWVLDNTSGSEQSFKINQIRCILPVPEKGKATQGIEVDVGGQKAYVEVPIADNGVSTIYKAQFLRETNQADPARDANRFAPNPEKAKQPGGMIFKIEAGKKLEGRPAVFDSSDVDWECVRQQVEAQLSLGVDKRALAEKNWKDIKDKAPVASKQPLPVYDPCRRLTDDVVTLKDGRVFKGTVTRDDEKSAYIATEDKGNLEFAKADVEKVEKGEMAKVREQVLAALPAALEAAKKKKQVVAAFDCEAGLSTGTYRISRSYRQLGEIKDEWLKAWEELGK
jgi:hypothetical protein